VNHDLEQTAFEIAERGRDALVGRLRGAFHEAASTHAAALTLEDGQIEEMVQRAADRADGLQWRRALASVASEELGIGLGEALGHPAVVRAHAIVGAPSYEDELAELGPLPDLPEPSVAVENGDRHEIHIRVTGIHLGGIAGLSSPEPGVELWFSDDGLDIIRATKEPFGRLSWAELRALEVPDVRSRFARRRRPEAFLVVRGQEGDASFEIPGVTPQALREQLAPVLEARAM
jgi:hypothetical protein